ncbi:hypothetical protein BJV78DRAFT_1255408, partial [Lactifluus subvellereus]
PFDTLFTHHVGHLHCCAFSALTLCSILTGVVRADGPRTLCTGDTCTSIGQLVGANQSALESMNPGMKCNGALTPGDVMCTKWYTPACTLNQTATSTTCDVLATTWNITVDDFVEYNGQVNNDCNNLVIGNTYCVSIEGCYPGNKDAICEQK